MISNLIPVEINEGNTHLLQKTFKLDVYFQDLKLVYIIKIPLITHLEFSIFKLFPLPSKAINNTFTFIQPSSEYIAINRNKQNYLPIRESVFQDCIEILTGKFLCPLTQPILLADENHCEIELYTQAVTDSRNCDIRVIDVAHNIWMQLQNANSWLFVTKKPELLSISCDDNSHSTVQISGNGIISLRRKCHGYSKTAMLKTTAISTNFIKTDYIPQFNLTSEIIPKINEHMRIVKTTKTLKQTAQNLKELGEASIKLHDLEAKTSKVKDELRLKQNITISHTMNFAIIIVIFFIICAVITSIYCYTNKFRTVSSMLAGFSSMMQPPRYETEMNIPTDRNIELRTTREAKPSIASAPTDSLLRMY